MENNNQNNIQNNNSDSSVNNAVVKQNKNPNSVYTWYKDRPTMIALITGLFSTIISTISALGR